MAKKLSHSEIIQKYNTYPKVQKEGQSDVAYYKQLAKIADQRMVELEKLSKQDNYKGVLGYAYKTAQENIKQMTGKESATRFNVALKKNADGTYDQRNLHARISAVKDFLESPTSMKSRIDKIYKERANTLNEELGTNYSWKEMANFWQTYDSIKKEKDYGSKTVLKAVSALRHVVKAKDINDVIEGRKTVADSEVVNTVAQQLLKQGYTFNDFTK